MRPAMRTARLRAWAVLAATGVVSAIILALVHDWGESEHQAEQARQRWQSLQGQLDLGTQIERQKTYNEAMAGRMARLRDLVGVQRVSPFVLANDAKENPDLFRTLYYTLRDDLRTQAVRYSVAEYHPELGFSFPDGRPPPDDDIGQWLTMLQLVSKAGWLALHTPDREVQLVRFHPIRAAQGVLQGAPGRPALLREYPFRLTVRCTLRAALWLLHEFSAEDEIDEAGAVKFTTAAHRELAGWFDALIPEVRKSVRSFPAEKNKGRISPLAVNGLSIDSKNLAPIDQLTQLEVTFDLAGMEFLAEGAGPIAPRPTAAAPASSSRNPPRRPPASTGRTSAAP